MYDLVRTIGSLIHIIIALSSDLKNYEMILHEEPKNLHLHRIEIINVMSPLVFHNINGNVIKIY